MYYWHHMTKQVFSCKSSYTFWLLNHCFDAIFQWLYFLNILRILDFYPAFFYILYNLIVAFSLIFCNFFSFLIITITFSLITLFHLLLAHAFSLVFIDFTIFKFPFWSSTSYTLFLWFSFAFCFLLFLFEYFFFDFLVVFYSLTLFLWISCCRWLLLFFLGNFWLRLCSVIAIFFYNVIWSYTTFD